MFIEKHQLFCDLFQIFFHSLNFMPSFIFFFHHLYFVQFIEFMAFLFLFSCSLLVLLIVGFCIVNTIIQLFDYLIKTFLSTENTNVAILSVISFFLLMKMILERFKSDSLTIPNNTNDEETQETSIIQNAIYFLELLNNFINYYRFLKQNISHFFQYCKNKCLSFLKDTVLSRIYSFINYISEKFNHRNDIKICN